MDWSYTELSFWRVEVVCKPIVKSVLGYGLLKLSYVSKFMYMRDITYILVQCP